jgi:hypothetical protein
MPEVSEKCRDNFSSCLPTVYHSVYANPKTLPTLPFNSFCIRGGSVQPITHFHPLLRIKECLELYFHFTVNRHNVFKHRNYLGMLLSFYCYQCPKETWSKIMVHTNKQHVSTQPVSPTLSRSKSTWPPRTKLTGKLASTAIYDDTMSRCMYKTHVILYTLYRYKYLNP